MSAMPRLTAIVAMTPERIIGRNGSLPWHLPGDLAFFKKTTSGHPIVMGRKTFDSIGRPLPNRRNIVITRDPHWSAPGVETIHSPDELAQLPDLSNPVFIIGGAEIFTAFLPHLDDLIVSHVKTAYPGDTWFPEFKSFFPHSALVESHPDFDVRHWSRPVATHP